MLNLTRDRETTLYCLSTVHRITRNFVCWQLVCFLPQLSSVKLIVPFFDGDDAIDLIVCMITAKTIRLA